MSPALLCFRTFGFPRALSPLYDCRPKLVPCSASQSRPPLIDQIIYLHPPALIPHCDSGNYLQSSISIELSENLDNAKTSIIRPHCLAEVDPTWNLLHLGAGYHLSPAVLEHLTAHPKRWDIVYNSTQTPTLKKWTQQYKVRKE